MDLEPGREWDDGEAARTRIVAIGAAGAMDADELRRHIDACTAGAT